MSNNLSPNPQGIKEKSLADQTNDHPDRGDQAHDVLTPHQPRTGRLERIQGQMTTDTNPEKSARSEQITVEERGNNVVLSPPNGGGNTTRDATAQGMVAGGFMAASGRMAAGTTIGQHGPSWAFQEATEERGNMAVPTPPNGEVGTPYEAATQRMFSGDPMAYHMDHMNQFEPNPFETAPMSVAISPVPNTPKLVMDTGGTWEATYGEWTPSPKVERTTNPMYVAEGIGQGTETDLSKHDPPHAHMAQSTYQGDSEPVDTKYPAEDTPGFENPLLVTMSRLDARLGCRLKTSSSEQRPSTTFIGTIKVDKTDPEFSKRTKDVYTVSQAASAIYKLDPSVSKSLKTEAGKSGIRTARALERFIDATTRGHKISPQLTVGLIVYVLTDDPKHILYQRVQDLVCAWMNIQEAQQPALLKHVLVGVVPEELLFTSDLTKSPGMARLQSDPMAYIRCYELIYAALTYEREGTLVHLSAIQRWKDVAKYAQRDGEPLMYALTRERVKFTHVIDGCRVAGLESEVPSNVARIANLQGVVHNKLWQATERRVRYHDKKMLAMTMTQISHELMGQERRDEELRVTETALAGVPQKQRNTERPKQHKERPTLSTTYQKQTRQSTSSQVKTCTNHPTSTNHTTRECTQATARGVCYPFIRGKCNRGSDCRFTHSLDQVTDADKRDAAEKAANQTKKTKPTYKAKVAPTIADEEQYIEPRGTVEERLKTAKVYPAIANVAATEPSDRACVQWADDSNMMSNYTPDGHVDADVGTLNNIRHWPTKRVNAAKTAECVPDTFRMSCVDGRLMHARISDHATLETVFQLAASGGDKQKVILKKQGETYRYSVHSSLTLEQAAIQKNTMISVKLDVTKGGMNSEERLSAINTLDELLCDSDEETVEALMSELTDGHDADATPQHSDTAQCSNKECADPNTHKCALCNHCDTCCLGTCMDQPDDFDFESLLDLINHQDQPQAASAAVNKDVTFAYRGTIDKLSNWQLGTIMVHKVPYMSLEHYFQAQKFNVVTSNVLQESTRRRLINNVCAATTAAEAQHIAHQQQQHWTKEEYERWNARAAQVMHTGALAKFAQSKVHMELLLATGNQNLIEISSADKFWGAQSDRKGKNTMGKILMSVRHTLREAPGLISAVHPSTRGRFQESRVSKYPQLTITTKGNWTNTTPPNNQRTHEAPRCSGSVQICPKNEVVALFRTQAIDAASKSAAQIHSRPNAMSNRLSVCVNTGTCMITPSPVVHNVVNTNNGIYIVASETARNDAIQESKAAGTAPMNLKRPLDATAAVPKSITQGESMQYATHVSKQGKQSDGKDGTITTHPGSGSDTGSGSGSGSGSGTGSGGGENTTHNPLLEGRADLTEGPGICGATTQARINGMYLPDISGEFGFTPLNRTRNSMSMQVVSDLPAVWTLQEGQSAMTMHLRLRPESFNEMCDMASDGYRYAIAIRPESMTYANWHSNGNAEGISFWDNNCVIGTVSPSAKSIVRFDGVAPHEVRDEQSKLRLAYMTMIPAHAIKETPETQVLNYNLYAKVVCKERLSDYRETVKWDSKIWWKHIITIRLDTELTLAITNNDLIVRRPVLPIAYYQLPYPPTYDTDEDQAPDADPVTVVHPVTPTGSHQLHEQNVNPSNEQQLPQSDRSPLDALADAAGGITDSRGGTVKDVSPCDKPKGIVSNQRNNAFDVDGECTIITTVMKCASTEEHINPMHEPFTIARNQYGRQSYGDASEPIVVPHDSVQCSATATQVVLTYKLLQEHRPANGPATIPMPIMMTPTMMLRIQVRGYSYDIQPDVSKLMHAYMQPISCTDEMRCDMWRAVGRLHPAEVAQVMTFDLGSSYSGAEVESALQTRIALMNKCSNPIMGMYLHMAQRGEDCDPTDTKGEWYLGAAFQVVREVSGQSKQWDRDPRNRGPVKDHHKDHHRRNKNVTQSEPPRNQSRDPRRGESTRPNRHHTAKQSAKQNDRRTSQRLTVNNRMGSFMRNQSCGNDTVQMMQVRDRPRNQKSKRNCSGCMGCHQCDSYQHTARSNGCSTTAGTSGIHDLTDSDPSLGDASSALIFARVHFTQYTRSHCAKYSLKVDGGTHIGRVESLIHQKEGIPPSEQKWICGVTGREIRDIIFAAARESTNDSDHTTAVAIHESSIHLKLWKLPEGGMWSDSDSMPELVDVDESGESTDSDDWMHSPYQPHKQWGWWLQEVVDKRFSEQIYSHPHYYSSCLAVAENPPQSVEKIITLLPDQAHEAFWFAVDSYNSNMLGEQELLHYATYVWLSKIGIKRAEREQQRIETCLQNLHMQVTIEDNKVSRLMKEIMLDRLIALRNFIVDGAVKNVDAAIKSTETDLSKHDPTDKESSAYNANMVELTEGRGSVLILVPGTKDHPQTTTRWKLEDTPTNSPDIDWSTTRIARDSPPEQLMSTIAIWSATSMLDMLESGKLKWQVTLKQCLQMQNMPMKQQNGSKVKTLMQQICSTSWSVYARTYDLTTPHEVAWNNMTRRRLLYDLRDKTTAVRSTVPGPRQSDSCHGLPFQSIGSCMPTGITPVDRDTTNKQRTHRFPASTNIIKYANYVNHTWGFDPVDTLSGAHLMCNECSVDVGIVGRTMLEKMNHITGSRSSDIADIYNMLCTSCGKCKDCCKHRCNLCNCDAKQGFPWCRVCLVPTCESHHQGYTANTRQSAANATKAIAIRMDTSETEKRAGDVVNMKLYTGVGEDNKPEYVDIPLSEAIETYNHANWTHKTQAEALIALRDQINTRPAMIELCDEPQCNCIPQLMAEEGDGAVSTQCAEPTQMGKPSAEGSDEPVVSIQENRTTAVIAMLPVSVTNHECTDSDDEVTLRKEYVANLDVACEQQHNDDRYVQPKDLAPLLSECRSPKHAGVPEITNMMSNHTIDHTDVGGGSVNSDARPNGLAQNESVMYLAKDPTRAHKLHIYNDCKYLPLMVNKVCAEEHGERSVCITCTNRKTGRKSTRRSSVGGQQMNNLTNALSTVSLNAPLKLMIEVTPTDTQDLADITRAILKTKSNVTVTGAEGEQVECVIAPTMLPGLEDNQYPDETEGYEQTEQQSPGKYQELLGFTAFLHMTDAQNRPVIVVPDTAAEVSVIKSSLVNPKWACPNKAEMEVAGSIQFNDTKLQGERRVPLHMRWGDDPVQFDLRPSKNVLDELRGADILMGVPALAAMGATIDCRQSRIMFEDTQQCIFLEPVTTIVARQESKPLKVVSLCGGAEVMYCAIRDLGFRVEEWIAHEIDSDARCVARSIVPEITHPSPQDILKLPVTYVAQQHPDVVVLTSPCQPFSRCQTSFKPHGMNDPRAEPLLHGSHMIAHAMQKCKGLMFLSEQVECHRLLKGVPEEQDRLIGADSHGFSYQRHNAKDAGSPSSRPRRLAQNITTCSLNDIPKVKPIDPNFVVNKGCSVRPEVLPCIVASQDTHNVPKCDDPAIGERALNTKEKTRAMGFPSNLIGGTSARLTERKGAHIIGMALNYFQVRLIFANLDPNRVANSRKAVVSPTPLMLGATGDALEKSFLHMSPERTLEWMTNRMAEIKFEVPKLRLQLRDENMLPYRSKTRNTVQAGLSPAVSKWTKNAISKGWIRKAEFTHDLWVAATFFKKKDREDDEGLPVLRPLVDQRILSSALKHPLYWLESMASPMSMKANVASCARYFLDLDLASGYNMLFVHPDSLHFQGVWIAGELYVYLVTIQGQSSAACWFNYVLEYAMDAMLGSAHSEYYTRFVDDFCIYAATKQQVENRHKIVKAALIAIGFEISDKLDGQVKQVGNCAGVKFTSEGISLNDDGINALKLAIAKSPQRAADCKTLIGSILYAHTAFSLNPDDITWFARMLQPMHQACTSVIDTKGKRLNFKWTPQCEANRIELEAKVPNIPRMFTHFNELVTDETCLYIMSDSCDTGGACTLHWVKVRDARDVIPEVHLRDPQMSRLLDCKYRCFSPKTQEQPTFLLEYTMAHTGVVEWGNLITVTTFKYPPGDEHPCKIGLGTDSSTAQSQMSRLTKSLIFDIPPEPIPYISARAKRMLDMVDKISYSRHWPMVVRHTAGRSNSLCDLISRIAFQLKAVADTHKNERAIVYPLRVHTYHEETQEPNTDPLGNLTFKGIKLTDQQTDVLAQAYADDVNQFKKVRMCDIYNALNTDGKTLIELPSAEAERIRSWMHKRFHIKDRIMWTQSTFIQLKDSAYVEGAHPEDSAEALDQSVMVMVIPANAKISISDPAPINCDEATDEIKAQMNLRQNIMWIAHEASMHAGAVEMARAIRLIAWWNNILSDCKHHIETCSICIQRQRPALGVGMSTGAAQRLSTIQFDHCVLDPIIAENTLVWGVLTIVDVATGCICLAPARSKHARETAFLLFTYWIRTYGIPKIICSDADAGYLSNVMKGVTALLGVCEHNASARAQKGTAAHSERANAYVRKAERCMIAAGNASTKEQLSMYLAMAEIMANQQSLKGDHTTFERMYGQTPITVMDLVAPTVFPNPDTEGMKELDAQFIKSIADCTRRLTEWKRMCTDERSRSAVLDADVVRACGRATIFDIRPGDAVSYKGVTHTLTDMNGPTNEPITATIQAENGTQRKVQYTALRPLGMARPTINIPLISEVPDLKFVLADENGVITGGIVQSTLDNFTLKVHTHEANCQMNRWLPLWVVPGNTPTRSKKAPEHAEQYIDIIMIDDVVATGSITTGGVLSENLQEYLSNQDLQ